MYKRQSHAGEEVVCLACNDGFQLPPLGRLQTFESRHDVVPPSASRSKIDELAIFTTGFGVVIFALTLWLTFALAKPAGGGQSNLAFLMAIATATIFILLGIAVAKLRNKAIVIVTLILISSLFVADIVFFYNFAKSIFSVLIGSLIATEGYMAFREIDGKTDSGIG